jgi:hypothetical protein
MSRDRSLRRVWNWLRGEPWRLTAAALGLIATVLGLATGVFDLWERLSPEPQESDRVVGFDTDNAKRIRETLAGQLGKRYGTTGLEQLYALAREQRALQLRLLATLEDDLGLADRVEDERKEAVDAAVGEWNDLVNTYNENDRAMAALETRLSE